MKFKRHIEIEKGLKQIDIAPLIDVVFLLIIFFMLTSSFVLQPGIKVKLPRAVTSEVIGQESVSITVSAENVIYLFDKVVTLKELKKNLENLKVKKIPILIKADRRASLGRVVEIWDLCRQLGIEGVNIATYQEENE
jgi:biopolymer transport protein ExbD